MGAKDRVPRTLAQAQELVGRLWPGREAPARAWLSYHRQRAELFAIAAEADPGHRNEALYLACIEREEADRIAHSMGEADGTNTCSGPR